MNEASQINMPSNNVSNVCNPPSRENELGTIDYNPLSNQLMNLYNKSSFCEKNIASKKKLIAAGDGLLLNYMLAKNHEVQKLDHISILFAVDYINRQIASLNPFDNPTEKQYGIKKPNDLSNRRYNTPIYTSSKTSTPFCRIPSLTPCLASGLLFFISALALCYCILTNIVIGLIISSFSLIISIFLLLFAIKQYCHGNTPSIKDDLIKFDKERIKYCGCIANQLNESLLKSVDSKTDSYSNIVEKIGTFLKKIEILPETEKAIIEEYSKS